MSGVRPPPRLRVLYVIESLGLGGAEQSLASLVAPLVRLGVALDVVCLYDRPGLSDDVERAGASVHSVAGAGGRAGRTRRVRALIAEARPDLVHTTLFEADLSGRLAARSRGVPVVSSLVNEGYGAAQRASPTVPTVKLAAAQALDAATARLVTRFHAVSGHVADTMSRRLLIRRSRIEVVPRGRDPLVLGEPSAERRARARQALDLDPRVPVLLALARHEHQKGLDVLLRAVPYAIDRAPAVLLVAGREGNESAALRRLAAAVPEQVDVRLLGPRRDVGDLLAASDVFVLPSRWEGFPGTTVEAMAMGVPIVASDLPPVREALGATGAAVLVPSEDPSALAGGIRAGLAGAVPRHALDAARERFLTEYTVERIATRMLGFYERALAGRRVSGA